MSTERLVKWSKESQEFFEKAKNNSIILDLVISFGCASQTGEGFEELVNTINSENIKRKVKKVIITDTSYLYRHGIQNFQKYSDISIPAIWFLNRENRGKGDSKWFADKIEIKKGEEVIIVDDELLAHEVWREKLKKYEKEIKVKYFTQGVEALKYLKSLENKEKVLLLTDYKLKGQEVNGDRYNRGRRHARQADTCNRRGSFKNKRFY
jgi:hypothetical protein